MLSRLLPPLGLRRQYLSDVRAAIKHVAPAAVITEDDLVVLPVPIAKYLRNVGVVGHPRVLNFRAAMHGRIRQGPSAPWMFLTAEQHNFFAPPSRFFYLTARRGFVPVQVFHRYSGPHATMHVKAAGLITVARAAGEEMTIAETVTLFNDMCLMAPATLIDPAIKWDPVDDRHVRASFTNAGRTIQAELTFDEAGNLVDFESNDRFQSGADGALRRLPWSTPWGGYRTRGPFRLGTRGEGRWHEPSGDYAYIELEIDEVEYNVRVR